MKVLLVAPHTNLLYAEEEVQSLLSIKEGIDIIPLIGNVTHTDLLREIEQEYDVLWLCTHGSEDGILLSDGILQSSLLVALVREKFQLIVLNTCVSFKVAQMIQNETSAEVIATIVEVPDLEAFQTGTIFARELAKAGSIEKAYYRARPGNNRSYIRLAGRTVTKEKTVGVDDTVLHELQMAVFGNSRINFAGMMNELKEIRQIVDELASKITKMEQSGHERSEIITEVRDEVAELRNKVNQLDGTIGWKPHPMIIGFANIFGSVLVIGELIRLLAYFF